MTDNLRNYLRILWETERKGEDADTSALAKAYDGLTSAEQECASVIYSAKAALDALTDEARAEVIRAVLPDAK